MTDAESTRLTARIEDARRWAFEQALPLWSTTGVDGELGFVEELHLDGTPNLDAAKRLRVQARQVYVFSHASLLGFEPGLEVARNGWDFMRTHAWRDGRGWARAMDRRGAVLDDTLDLYDQAFALLAIAWWHRASGDRDALALADATLDVIDARLTAPSGRGFLSEDGPAADHLQNPHMHLFESLTALWQATGDERFHARATEIREFARETLIDLRSGTLAEYYDASWNRAAGTRGRIVEPGHHYEWVWLLLQHAPDALDLAEPLFAFAEAHGWDAQAGMIYDEILDDGSVHRSSFRSWPHTESLKAQVALAEHGRPLDAPGMLRTLDALLDRFLAGPVPGAWIDRFGPDGSPAVDKIPASTLYHAFLAIAEVLRVNISSRAD